MDTLRSECELKTTINEDLIAVRFDTLRSECELKTVACNPLIIMYKIHSVVSAS